MSYHEHGGVNVLPRKGGYPEVIVLGVIEG